MIYYFFLGRQTELAQAELVAVLSRFGLSIDLQPVTPNIVSLDVPSLSAQELMQVLGGTFKIAEGLGEVPSVDTVDIENALIDRIEKTVQEKNRRTFALAEHERNHLDAVSHQHIKKALIAHGISARYIETSRIGAEAGLLLEGDVTEYHVIHLKDKTVLAKTVAVQDVHNWTHRDMDKPYRDKKKGMIPPKLARSMVNIAVGARDPKTLSLFDPFCGTGTILMEAMLLGLKVAGSDLDRQAVHGAGENLQWLVKEYGEKHGLTENYRLSVQDVTQVTMQESGTQADVIVTEPFLGKPNPLPAQVDNMLKGLEKLYLGAFKQWKQVLKVGGVVAITLPVVSTGKSVKTVQNLIDRLESLGYTRENGSFLYTKLHATVQRAVSFYRLNTK